MMSQYWAFCPSVEHFDDETMLNLEHWFQKIYGDQASLASDGSIRIFITEELGYPKGKVLQALVTMAVMPMPDPSFGSFGYVTDLQPSELSVELLDFIIEAVSLYVAREYPLDHVIFPIEHNDSLPIHTCFESHGYQPMASGKNLHLYFRRVPQEEPPRFVDLETLSLV
jgi:hypothetical protein